MERMKNIREHREVTYLSKDEIAKILGGIKNIRDKAIYTVMYYAGLRASEVGLLTMGDLRLRDGKIFVHRLKGSLSGDHTLSPVEVRALRAWMITRNSNRAVRRWGTILLFPSTWGGPISRSSIYKKFSKYASKAGIEASKCHPHILKHSIATSLLDSGENIEIVQDWLGHKDIRSTQVYAKVTNKKRDEAARRFYGKD